MLFSLTLVGIFKQLIYITSLVLLCFASPLYIRQKLLLSHAYSCPLVTTKFSFTELKKTFIKTLFYTPDGDRITRHNVTVGVSLFNILIICPFCKNLSTMFFIAIGII